MDRYNEARLSIYEGIPTENMSRYLLLQEYRGHTDVRWLELRNRNGGQLRFTTANTPFEMSVLPYTAEELESTQHTKELPAPHYTVVNVLARQHGVGDDNSWSAPVCPKYCISGERNVEFLFVTECI